VWTKVLPRSASGEKRGSLNNEVGISAGIESVWNCIDFLEAVVEPSGSRLVRRVGEVESSPERSSERVTICDVTKLSARNVRLSPLCSALPTILPKRSWD
jgi:hypothetical protein